MFLAVRQPKSSTGLGALKVQWLILVFQIGKSGWWAMGVMVPVQSMAFRWVDEVIWNRLFPGCSLGSDVLVHCSQARTFF